MGKAGALLLGALLAGGLAAQADGRSAATITLRANQTLRLAGTNVLCGAGSAAGLTFIDCGIVNSAGLEITGSYVALLGQNGRVSIVGKKGKQILFDRIAGPMMREAGLVAHPGDTILLAGVSTISCSAANVSGRPTIFCDRVDSKSNFEPGSYAFGIGDTVVTALGWDAKRKVHLIHSWPEQRLDALDTSPGRVPRRHGRGLSPEHVRQGRVSWGRGAGRYALIVILIASLSSSRCSSCLRRGTWS